MVQKFKYSLAGLTAMNWTKLLYVLVIALIYVPMVFLGANVFFPKYTGSDSYYDFERQCYPKYPISERLAPEQQEVISKERQVEIDQCLVEQKAARLVWEEERGVYDGYKYMAIVGFNLAMLLVVLFFTLKEAIIIGLFTGAMVTTFGATIRYWDYARTKIGFGLLLATFFVMLYFINKRQEVFVKKKK